MWVYGGLTTKQPVTNHYVISLPCVRPHLFEKLLLRFFPAIMGQSVGKKGEKAVNLISTIASYKPKFLIITANVSVH